MIVEKVCDSIWKQNFAMAMNLSETAFVIPTESCFEIRYFTPTKEAPLCGHATLASAHIIYEPGLFSNGTARIKNSCNLTGKCLGTGN